MDPPPSRQNQTTSQHPDSQSSSSIHDEDCAFCQIITAYPPVSPLDSSFVDSKDLDPEKLYPPAFVLLSTEHVVAFLDIFPLVRGHVLLCPRRHAEKVGDMTAEEGMEIGRLLPLLSRAITFSTMPDIPHAEADYNVVQNNGPGAAQVVPHTHFHIIPRYPFESSYTPYTKDTPNTEERVRKPPPQGIQATAILFGRGQRHYRDDEDAEGLVREMRGRIAEEWRREFGGERSELSKDGAGEMATGVANEDVPEEKSRQHVTPGPDDKQKQQEVMAAVRNRVVPETGDVSGRRGDSRSRGRGNL